MSIRRFMLVALIVVAMGGASCGPGSGIGAISCDFGGAGSEPGFDALSGTWQARFEMESSQALPQATTAQSVVGELVIDPAPADAASPPSPTPRPVMRGHFGIDFTPLGFALDGTSVIAWHSAAPTLSIILHPDVDHGNIAITGIQKGDTIDGQWQLLGDPMRAAGKVQLTHVR